MDAKQTALESEHPLIVYMDFKSPYAWLALEPTLEMARELGITVDWRPFVLDIPSYLGTAKLDRSGKVEQQNRSAEQWSGVKYAYFDCRRYANLRQLTVRGTTKIWDTGLAAIGMLWARRQGEAILERYMKAVYEPFWKRELDVEDLSVIRETLRQAGADTTGFDDYALGPGAEENAALQTDAFDAGIFGVPTYLVNGEMYFGREHLPRIRWHLQGEQGPAPDIAYEHHGAARSETSSTLEVTIDFANPECWLALAPTLALAEQCDINLDWQVLPSTPAKPTPAEPNPAAHATQDDSRGSRHRRFRAAYRNHNTARYAPNTLSAIADKLDTRPACLGLLWLKHEAADQLPEYLRRVFEGIWIQGENYGTTTEIAALLRELGLDTDDFDEYANTAGDVALEQAQHRVMTQGVPGTPAYLLGEEPFLGRQHLPLIQDRLGF